MSAPVLRFSEGSYLRPLYGEHSRPRAVNLAPNAVYQPGSILLPSSGTANDVQTIAFTGSPTGGTFTLTGVDPITGLPFTTAPITYATSGTGDTNIQTAINAALGSYGSVSVASLVVTFGGLLAAMPIAPLALGTNGLTGGTTPSLTVTHTTTGSTAAQYSFYNAAGSGTPTCILKYGCATDAAGAVTFGAQAGGAYMTGVTYPYAMAYFGNTFATQDLVGLDTNAATKLGRLSSGTVSAGILEVIGF
jgi:hypothetical protein